MPYPPDYGGVYDLFYKLKSLHELGIKIHLHCFEYGRSKQPELNKYCEEVHYYKRYIPIVDFIFRLPYIVSSRKNKLLLQNILRDTYPVLLEGIHCTYYLYNDSLKERTVLVRLHNVEFEYYAQLMKSAKGLFKKIYFYIESKLLKRYENAIANKAIFIAVNKKDQYSYQEIFKAERVKFLPVFLPFNEVKSLPGKGTFCLYHGNLSVPENEKAAIWLLKNVFNDLNIDFVVAGKNPTENLKFILSKNKNATLVGNPSIKRMEELIADAHIHVLPSFNNTGIKIKLLNALFNGRFIMTNAASIEGTGLETLCEKAETAADYKNSINEIFTMSFEENEILKRNEILKNEYDNRKNAKLLLKWISENNEAMKI